MAGLLSKDSTLSYHDATEWKEFDFLLEIPEMGSDPQPFDTTHLKSKRQEALPGLDAGETLDFKFLYDEASDDYTTLKGFQAAGVAKDFRVQYPDKTAVYFKAIPAVRMNAAAVNAGLTFNAKMFMQSDISDTEPTFGA